MQITVCDKCKKEVDYRVFPIGIAFKKQTKYLMFTKRAGRAATEVDLCGRCYEDLKEFITGNKHA